MFAKKNRLPGYKTPQVLNSKTTFHSSFFSLKVLPSDQIDSRIGLIISIKIAKKAVDRNRIKRLLREAIKPHLKNLKPNHDLLFLTKHSVKNKTLKQISPAINSVLKKAKVLIKNNLNEKASS